MISVDEAHGKVAASIRPLSTERVATAEAFGRVLAAGAQARLTQPPFAASAMDGYAIRAEDKVAGRVLTVTGEIAAGGPSELTVGPGEAVRIFTGAPVPEGAETIIIQEDVHASGNRITLGSQLDEGDHIRPAGNDFSDGQTLDCPRRLSAADLSLLGAMNVTEVEVARRPIVAILPTGDELVGLGETPAPSQIIASSGYAIAAMLRQCGAQVRLMPIAPDRPAVLGYLLDQAKSADLVLTLGGASVGDHDLVQGTAGDRGLDLSFYKIRMRPGKPLICGTLGDAVFLGLPGNPVSAFVCARIFAVPALAALQGLAYRPPMLLEGHLAGPVAANGNREHYMRAKADIVDGRWLLDVFGRQDSSLLSVLSDANALVRVEPHAPAQEAGDKVSFLLTSADTDLTC